MKPDYLWDKTGEPDPEIVRLEQVLGTLRYQPRPFEIPSAPAPVNRMRLVSLLAIAAAISFAVIAVGLWLKLNRPVTGQISEIRLPLRTLPPLPLTTAEKVPTHNEAERDSTVRYHRASRRKTEAEVAERKEAEAAKEQLMLALRLASSKLSLAQKKAQGVPNIIRNQHKVG